MDSNILREDIVKSDRIIYTPSVFAKTNLLHLQEIGTLEALVPHTSKRKNLASYLFIMVIKGKGTLSYNNNTYNLKAGDCAFIDCHKFYSHHTEKDLWQIKWVHFYGPNTSAIYDKYIQRGGQLVFKPKNQESYINIISEIFKAANTDDSLRDMVIFNHITKLLLLLMQESVNITSIHKSSKKQNIQHIKDFIDQNYCEKITLDQLSEKFYINKFYLSRIFKEQFGISVINYVQQLKITNAKKLLRFSNLTIDEIAAECGIEDSNYFSRMFKKIEHLSPGEYRKLW